MNKITIIFLMILIVPIVIASIESLGTFSIDDEVELLQICANCTYVNITSVTAPNSSIILSGVLMNKSGVRYNYSLTPQSSIGTYQVCGSGDLDGEETVWCYNFEITQVGYKPTTAQGFLYSALLFIAIISFALILFIGFNIDASNYDRETVSGKVISINWKRYFRPFCWGIAYALAIWVFHLSRSIADIFLESTFLSSFFRMMFLILLNLSYPLIVLFFTLLIASWVVDIKNKRLINRGLQPK